MKSFTGQGVFWVDGKEDERVTGTLTYEPTAGVTLDLIGTFGDVLEQGSFKNEDDNRDRIHGVANGKLVTLVDASRSELKIQMPGIPSATYRARYLLMGANVQQPRLLQFKSVIVKVSNLTQWVGRSGIEVNVDWSDGQPPSKWTYIFRPPQPEHADFASSGVVKMGVEYTLGGDNVTESHIRQSAYIKVQPGSPVDIQGALTLAGKLRDLVVLASDAPADFEAVLLEPNEAIYVDEPRRPEPLELYAHFSQASKPAQRSRLEMLFTYAQFGGIEGVARWLHLSDDIAPAIGTLMSLRHGDFLYAENRLQNVTHAAESLHRIRFGSEAIATAEHAARVARIIGAHSGEDRSWLEQKLQYSNEPNLRRRLIELVEFAGSPALALVLDKKKWATAVAASRNRLTHFQGRAPAPDSLFYLSESVYQVLLLCILRMVDAPDDLLNSVAGNHHFAWLRERLPGAVHTATSHA